MSDITVFVARRILTMDPGRPTASAIAVRDGRILSVGTIESMQPWLRRYSHTIDETFANLVLLPGFIDPHTHLSQSGAYMFLNYIGPIPSPGPDRINPALPTREAVMARLHELHAEIRPASEPLFAWGFDPGMQGGHLHRDELDLISRQRPVAILSYAPHFVYANSAMLKLLGADESLQMHGLGRDPDGRLNGRFIEMEALNYALAPLRGHFVGADKHELGLRRMAQVAQHAGVTTTADMLFGARNFESEWRLQNSVVSDPDFPLRMVLVPYEAAIRKRFEEDVAAYVADLDARATDKIRFHGVKFFSDGSYPAMSLRLRPPGYLDGGNGLRGDIPWDNLAERMLPFWNAGVQIHAHANGDEAIDAVLDALAKLQAIHPRFDHRLTIEHYCISTPDQARRLKALGGLASVNCYFVHFRSQIHSEQAFGPDRAEATARLGSLEREGVTFALHSDFSLVVAPLDPLLAVWIAVNRIAADGVTVQAPGERIGVERALRAITIDAAYVLGMEREIGSLEVGKFADFSVLSDDPTAVDRSAVRDLRVWGTVLGGRLKPGL
ncbi:MAG TPA: amidohydrolase [Candidatus Binataceae bacterium]|nr:amidohydrolase [Candidatus Binataceae bacterium]